jgi:hypothetical protein
MMDVPGRSAQQILLDEMGNFIGSELTPRRAEGALDGLFLQIWMKNGEWKEVKLETLPSGLLQRGLHVDAWMIGSVETPSVSCETRAREGSSGTA